MHMRSSSAPAAHAQSSVKKAPMLYMEVSARRPATSGEVTRPSLAEADARPKPEPRKSKAVKSALLECSSSLEPPRQWLGAQWLGLALGVPSCPRAARRALRSRRSRAGALPRGEGGHFDRAHRASMPWRRLRWRSLARPLACFLVRLGRQQPHHPLGRHQAGWRSAAPTMKGGQYTALVGPRRGA